MLCTTWRDQLRGWLEAEFVKYVNDVEEFSEDGS